MAGLRLSHIALGILLLSVLPEIATARPEYAVKEKMSCTACHVTPWGGGPRTVMGKVYGTRGEAGSKTDETDLYYGELRAIAYWPFKAVSQSNSGVAEMEAAVSGNLPVVQRGGSELRAVATYQISPLAGSQLREGYARYSPDSDSANRSYWTVGHFYVPFGLLTDEHRTYSHIETNTTLNDYDTGGIYSRDFDPDLHVDIGMVNDFQATGAFSQKEITVGGIGNLRWNPMSLPFMLGASALYERISTQPEPYAFSFYGVLSLDRLNGGKYTGSILFESVYAKNWNNPAVNVGGGGNPGLPAFFAVNVTQSPELLTAPSFGNTATVKWDLNRVFQIFYKLDALTLDANNFSYLYTRHGVGFEWRLDPNVILNSRVEYATYPEEQSALAPFEAKESDFFTMVRLWF